MVSSAPALLQVRGLQVEFPSQQGLFQAVRDFSLEVNAGEIVGLVGESGAGKSTVGNAIIGLIDPPGRISQGEINLNGERLDFSTEAARRTVRGRRIGMIFQDPLTSLNPLFTVGSQLIETMMSQRGLGRPEATERAIRLLEQVGIPDPEVRIRQYPHQFSGGMRQRVVIALALCCDPELVIADEPTTALDVSVQAQVLALIRQLCLDRGVGVILVTHDMGVIAQVTDRVAVMYDGEIVETGPTQKIIGDPDQPYTKALIAAVPRLDTRLPRFPVVGKRATFSKPHINLSTHWLGQRPHAQDGGEILVHVESVTKDFITRSSVVPSWRRTFRALDNVSLQIKTGEVLGLVGESGSGKSTLAQIIARLLQPTAGRVKFAGTDLTRMQSERELLPVRQQMQMVFQDPFSSLNPRMRVRDIIAEPIRFHNLGESAREIRTIVDELLTHVGLESGAADRYPHSFSGGQRQRISIARALATRPRFLICDEPTSSLDVSIQAQILNLLKDLQEQLGLTILLISHDLPLVRQMCDRVAVMRHGVICETAANEDLFTRPQNEYTKLLLSLIPRLNGAMSADAAQATMAN